jgi:hypothetical protein
MQGRSEVNHGKSSNIRAHAVVFLFCVQNATKKFPTAYKTKAKNST